MRGKPLFAAVVGAALTVLLGVARPGAARAAALFGDTFAYAGESGAPVCSGTVREPSTYYAYVLDDPNAVQAIVTAGAGTGKV